MNLRVLKGSVAVLASIAIAFGAVGCSGKPSKDAVKAGIIKMIKEKGGSTYAEGVLNDYVSCVVDGSYDKVSSDTLQKLADGKIDVNAKTSDTKNVTIHMGISIKDLAQFEFVATKIRRLKDVYAVERYTGGSQI